MGGLVLIFVVGAITGVLITLLVQDMSNMNGGE